MRCRNACAAALGVLVLAASGGCDGGHGDAAPERAQPVFRGIFERDGSPTGFDEQAALGFTAIDSGPWTEELDPLAERGLTAFIWLGGYSNESCRFRESDAWVRRRVRSIARHPAVAAYLIDDEPLAAECPTAPAQIGARARLVKSIDPRPPTFVVLYRVPELKRFVGTVDILAVDRYPCSHRHGCRFEKIDAAIRELDRLGVRYWGVIQAFADEWYRLPTAAELHEQFRRWRASRMDGYLVFGWRWPDDRPALWLANQPRLRAQLAVENRRSLSAAAGRAP